MISLLAATSAIHPELCFVGDASVHLRSGEVKRLSQVSVMDEIVSYDEHLQALVYSPVVSSGAVPGSVGGSLSVAITVETIDVAGLAHSQTLSLTPSHLAPVLPSKRDVAPTEVEAQNVKVDDMLLCRTGLDGDLATPCRVTHVRLQHSTETLYYLWTDTGFPVVNGIIASSLVAEFNWRPVFASWMTRSFLLHVDANMPYAARYAWRKAIDSMQYAVHGPLQFVQVPILYATKLPGQVTWESFLWSLLALGTVMVPTIAGARLTARKLN